MRIVEIAYPERLVLTNSSDGTLIWLIERETNPSLPSSNSLSDSVDAP
jgi:hypothetical protein